MSPRARLLILAALALGACAPDTPADAPAGAPAPAPGEAGAPVAQAPEPAGDTASPPTPDSIWVGDPPTRVPGPLGSPSAAWTARTTHVARRVPGAPLLRAVRAARHDGYDRLVFAFDGALPGYHVEYVDRPARACGSGEAVFLDGDAWLLVRFSPAQAHTDEGHPTIPPGRTRFDLPVLHEAALTCDFEGEVAWVLGLAAPGGYRLTELGGPPRLAVDLRP